MGKFETSFFTAAYRERTEDRVKVIDFDQGVVIVVADGAGGVGAGDQAAESVIREVAAAASLEHDQDKWRQILRQTDFRVGMGESTCVVAACSERGFVGATVGDSQAWLLSDGNLLDLTHNRVRKPLLGSGEANPQGFSHPMSQGVLIVATDGFCNYVRCEVLLKELLRQDFVVLARRLAEMVRLPSGELWDDVAIVVCRPRPVVRQRQRYSLDELE